MKRSKTATSTTKRRRNRLALWTAASACWLLLVAAIAQADQAPDGPDPFATPETLDDLGGEIKFFEVESDVVTSVSRHPESLWGAAAAIYVITGEEMELTGVETLADALRMVPGLDVAAVDRNQSAISARGLNSIFADKMLVLMDGRPIYTPIFGGTLWYEWNTFLPDVDRIEVIRGPGGTLWGANAMNGVINIITKSAEDTQGTLVRLLGGESDLLQSEARYGGRFGEFSYRIFGRYGEDGGFGSDDGDEIEDDREEWRTGYRFDWDLGRGLTVRSTGEYYDSELGSVTTFIDPLAGGTASRVAATDKIDTELFTGMLRFEKDFSSGSSARLQFAGDHKDGSYPFLAIAGPAGFGLDDAFTLERKTWEVDFQHSFRLLRRHRLTWGGNFRQTKIDIDDSAAIMFVPPDDTLDVVGGFVQDEIDLWEGGRLTLGTKVEDNTFTDTNVQPSARLSHRIDDATTFWGAVSRAINTPAFGDVGVIFPNVPGPFGPVDFIGDSRVDDTELIAYEAGVRHRVNGALSLDLTGYYNDYDDLATFSGDTISITSADCVPVASPTAVCLDNGADAESYGVEGVVDLVVNEKVRGQVNATWQQLEIRTYENPNIPKWKVNVQSIWKLTPRLTFVPTMHYVDHIRQPSIFSPGTTIIEHDNYLRTDVALHYKHSELWPTLSLVFQNYDEDRRSEFLEDVIRPVSEVTTWWFIRLKHEI